MTTGPKADDSTSELWAPDVTTEAAAAGQGWAHRLEAQAQEEKSPGQTEAHLLAAREQPRLLAHTKGSAAWSSSQGLGEGSLGRAWGRSRPVPTGFSSEI